MGIVDLVYFDVSIIKEYRQVYLSLQWVYVLILQQSFLGEDIISVGFYVDGFSICSFYKIFDRSKDIIWNYIRC